MAKREWPGAKVAPDYLRACDWLSCSFDTSLAPCSGQIDFLAPEPSAGQLAACPLGQRDKMANGLPPPASRLHPLPLGSQLPPLPHPLTPLAPGGLLVFPPVSEWRRTGKRAMPGPEAGSTCTELGSSGLWGGGWGWGALVLRAASKLEVLDDLGGSRS
jgi:hypothetical protein